MFCMAVECFLVEGKGHPLAFAGGGAEKSRAK